MVKKIPYDYRSPSKDAVSIIKLIKDKSYSMPIDLGGPARFFGRDNRYISIGPHWMINILQSTGQNIEFSGRPKQLPWPHVDHEDGYLIIPFGQPMALRSCGTSAKIWVEKDRSIIDVVARDAFSGDSIAFQIHFLFRSEEIEVHYRVATTGSRTVIGACGEPGEHTEWGCDAHEVLNRTAISINTTPTVIEEGPADDTKKPYNPFGPNPKPVEPDPDPDPDPNTPPAEKIIITGQNLKMEVVNDA